MAFEVQALSVDLLSNRAMMSFQDHGNQAHINLMVPLETVGDQPASHLTELAKAAARRALQDALAAL
jgi:hypothetical protein